MNVLNEYRVVARLPLCHDDLETDGTQIKQTKRDRAPHNQTNQKRRPSKSGERKNHLVGQKRELDDNRIAAAQEQTKPPKRRDNSNANENMGINKWRPNEGDDKLMLKN